MEAAFEMVHRNFWKSIEELFSQNRPHDQKVGQSFFVVFSRSVTLHISFGGTFESKLNL